MPFKHGRLTEVLLNSLDVSTYLNSIAWAAQVDVAKTSTLKSTWHSYIPGIAHSQAAMNGYYDSTLTAVRATLQAAPGVLSYAPAGALVVGDQVRLISFNTVTYNENAKINEAVGFDWTAQGTAVGGVGVSLAPLAVYGVGAGVTPGGDGILTSTQSTTGAIGHLHVTGYSAGTHTFKFQDSTTLGGAYTDIAGGAFVNVTAVGAQRIIIPGTIRQFVRLLYTVATASATFAVSFART